MANKAPLPVDHNSPPMYEDIFATGQEAGDLFTATDSWDDGESAAASNIFSSVEFPFDQDTSPGTGGLVFPAIPSLDDLDTAAGLLGAESLSTGASNLEVAVPSGQTSQVTYLYYGSGCYYTILFSAIACYSYLKYSRWVLHAW